MTVAPAAKFVPVMVSAVPPAMPPDAGVTPVSVGADEPPNCVIAATEGTPLVSTRNSMYGPGAARFALAGAVTLSAPVPAVKLRGTKFWLILMLCVIAPSRMREAFTIVAAFGVCTANVCPYSSWFGADVIVGRGPLNR